MSLFPMFVKLDARPCLVVGAGSIATPKIQSLLNANAQVTVVAPYASPTVQQWAAAGAVTWRAREFESADVAGMLLVITGTDRQPVNHLVAVAARAQGILVNSVDDPPDCDFYYGSVVQRNDLQIAISTAGKSPALAQRLRQEIDQLLTPGTGEWLDQIGRQRERILSLLPLSEGRKQLLHLLARREHCQPADCPVQQTLDQVLAKEGLPANRPKPGAQPGSALHVAPPSLEDIPFSNPEAAQ